MTKRHDYSKYFKKATRIDGSPYTILTEDRPDTLHDLVYEIHKSFDAWPNDWIYSQIENAFDELENDELDDINIQAEDSNNALLKWLYDSGFAKDCVQEAIDDGLCDGLSFMDSISEGQRLAIDQIYRQVNDWIEEQDKLQEGLIDEAELEETIERMSSVPKGWNIIEA